ncbi:MAG: transposase [Edaphocola sp.]
MAPFFPEEVCEPLFAFAMFRWAYNTPIKRTPYYYHHDFCSQVFSKKSIDDKLVSDMLKLVGENRTAVVAWMKSLLDKTGKGAVPPEFVMMDSTHVFSKSELLTVNAKGYNPDFDFEKQVRLMYLFSAQTKQPVYYRLINGNITDIKSMSLCIEEMNIQNVIYITDKGFYSKENIAMMKAQNLQYILPLQRSNQLINYEPLQKANFKSALEYFIYQNGIVWYYKYQSEARNFITFLDEGLRAKEEADYVARTTSHPENYTKEKFAEKLSGFGTLTFTYDIQSDKTPEEIYCAYQQRNEIETIFDAHKNFLKADLMYMQNRYVLEGWLTANFIAMIAYHKLYIRLKDINKLSKHSPKDIMELSKPIYKLNMNGEWKTSEISKKNIDITCCAFRLS